MNTIARICKWIFLGGSAVLALLGMLLCALIAYALFSRPPGGSHYYIGKEACAESRAWTVLPLPEQENTRELPMAMDSNSMCDYSGFVIFRASPEWQEAFRQCYARQPHFPRETEGVAEDLAQDTRSSRIREFIENHKWQPFHRCCLWELGSAFLDCTALRDASGEYILLHFSDF